MAVMLDTASIAALATERELIDAARAGDDRAFEELYARYSERIRAFILSRVRDHGRAEDIAQDVFMSALRRLRANSQQIAFKPWIYEIAKNACIDEYRRRRRSPEVSLDADEELVDGRRALLSLAPTPPAAVEGRQRLDDLRGAFGGLSESHHKLLVMRELEGLSYDEIGRRMDMSRQMVESTLFRARRKLAEEYEELASGRRCEHVLTVIEDGRALSARSLGIRERRRLARHLAHCQRCRVNAHLAGVDEALLRPSSVADKIAALLPFGLGKWLLRGGSGAKRALAKTGSHAATVQSVQAVATMPDASSTASSLGGAAVAAAVLALAGAGGAIVSADAGPGHARPAPAVLAPAAHRTANQGGPARAPSRQVATPGIGRRAGAIASSRSVSRAKRSHATFAGHGSRSGSGGGSAASSTSRRGGAQPARGSTGPGGAPKGISKVTTAGGSTVNQAGSTVKKVLNTVKTTAQQTGRTLSKTVSSASNTVSSTVKSVGNAASSALGNTGSAAGKTVSSTASAVGKTVSSTGSQVSNTVNGAVSSLTSPSGGSSGGGSGGSVAGAVKQAGQTVSSTVSSILP